MSQNLARGGGVWERTQVFGVRSINKFLLQFPSLCGLEKVTSEPWFPYLSNLSQGSWEDQLAWPVLLACSRHSVNALLLQPEGHRLISCARPWSASFSVPYGSCSRLSPNTLAHRHSPPSREHPVCSALTPLPLVSKETSPLHSGPIPSPAFFVWSSIGSNSCSVTDSSLSHVFKPSFCAAISPQF